jgi:hypothetical protein
VRVGAVIVLWLIVVDDLAVVLVGRGGVEGLAALEGAFLVDGALLLLVRGLGLLEQAE